MDTWLQYQRMCKIGCDKLDDTVNEFINNTYHRTVKMKPVNVKNNTYTDFKKECNDKDPNDLVIV